MVASEDDHIRNADTPLGCSGLEECANVLESVVFRALELAGKDQATITPSFSALGGIPSYILLDNNVWRNDLSGTYHHNRGRWRE